MLFLMFSPSQSLVSGSSSPMTVLPSKYHSSKLIPQSFDNWARSTSIDGFWAHGLSKDSGITLGDDDEGA